MSWRRPTSQSGSALSTMLAWRMRMSDRAGRDVVEALDLEAQPEEPRDAVQVPADPARRRR